MTIEKGREWGSSVLVPPNVIRASSDAELATNQQGSLCIVTAGDLWRTLGEPTIRHEGDVATAVSIDALEVTVNTTSDAFVLLASSSVQIGNLLSLSSAWRHRRFVVLTNCGLINDANVAPRAHPNDGVFDVVTFSGNMNFKQRLLSRQRLRTGTHLPHPHISVSRNTTFQTSRAHAHEVLSVDGITVKNWLSVSVRILPDFWRVII